MHIALNGGFLKFDTFRELPTVLIHQLTLQPMKKTSLFICALRCIQFLYSQTSGGPDAYGYSWKTSPHPTGPTYNWVDITSTGIEVQGLGNDNVAGPFGLALVFNTIKIPLWCIW